MRRWHGRVGYNVETGHRVQLKIRKSRNLVVIQGKACYSKFLAHLSGYLFVGTHKNRKDISGQRSTGGTLLILWRIESCPTYN